MRATARLWCTVLLTCVFVAWSTPVRATGAHPLARAQLTFGPQMPRVERPWHVRAAIESADAMRHPARRVRIVGEMTGHPMRPVEAELTRIAGEDEVYEGTVAFTMAGPWRITVRVDDLNDALTGVFTLDVVREDEGTGFDELRSVLDLHQPVRPNLIAPSWIAIAVVLLVLSGELIAAAALRRRAQRAADTASA